MEHLGFDYNFPVESSMAPPACLVSGLRELRNDAWDLHPGGDLLRLAARGQGPLGPGAWRWEEDGKIMGCRIYWNMTEDDSAQSYFIHIPRLIIS